MRPAAPFLAATLALHGALIAVLANRLAEPPRDPPKTAITVATLTPPAEAAAEPKPMPPAAPPAPPAQATRHRHVVHPHPRHPAKPPASSALRNEQPATHAGAEPGPPAVSAAPAPGSVVSAATNAAPAPARTPVSIPADYATANRKPNYPRLSRLGGEQGTVLLRVLVRPDGSAGEVQVRQSSGYPLLDEAALAAVRGWRFRPATLDGKPVEEWYLVPIPFKLQDD